MLKAVLSSAIVALAVGSVLTMIHRSLGRYSRLRRRLHRPAFIVSAVAALAVGMSGPAYATSYQNTGMVYRTATYECVEGHVYINNTSGFPHLDSYSASYIADTDNTGQLQACYSVQDQPNGFIRVKQILFVYVSGTGPWEVCSPGSWQYNSTYTWKKTTSYNFSYTCGHQWYYGQAGAFVYNGACSGSWCGGYISTYPNDVYAY